MRQNKLELLNRIGVIRAAVAEDDTSGGSDEPAKETESTDTESKETEAPDLSEITAKIDSVAEMMKKLSDDFAVFMDASAVDDGKAATVDTDNDGDTDVIVTEDGEKIDTSDLAADTDDIQW